MATLHLLFINFVSLFILIIACINFINLSTSKSIQRSREVGIRKALGASKLKLILQFMGESLLTTVVSFLLALATTEWVLLVLFENIGLHYISIVIALPTGNVGILQKYSVHAQINCHLNVITCIVNYTYFLH